MKQIISMAVLFSSASWAAPIDALLKGKLECTLYSVKRTSKDLGPWGTNIFGKLTVEINEKNMNKHFAPKVYPGTYRMPLGLASTAGEDLGWGYFNLDQDLRRFDNKVLHLDNDSQGTFQVDFKSGKGRYYNRQRMGGWPMNHVTSVMVSAELTDCKINP